MRLPRTLHALVGHHRRGATGESELPAALRGTQLRKGLFRLLLLVLVVVLIVSAAPGLGSIRTRLEHGSPGWLTLAVGLRLASALCYVMLFRAVFDPQMPRRLSYRVAMTEIGTNAFVPAGGSGGLAVGGWVLHRQGMSTERVVQRSAEFFVFTSAFNVGAVAVLGWLGAADIVRIHAALPLTLVPAVAATVILALAVAVIPRLASLTTRQQRHARHKPRWWALEILIMLGTGARGAITLFRERNPRAIAGGAGYLLFDIATLWAALEAFHGHAAVASLAMAYLVGQLAGEIPIPGGIGVVDGGLIGALVLYGLPLTFATAGSLAYRAISLGVPALFGGFAAVELGHTIRGWGADQTPALNLAPEAQADVEPAD